MKVFKAFLIFFSLLVASDALLAQSQRDSELNVKCTMVYGFLRYFQWPAHVSSNTYTIGIYGDEAFYQLMRSKCHGREKDGKKILVQKMNNLEDATSCNIVYLGRRNSKKFNDLKNIVQNKPILMVTNYDGLGQRGSCVNFIVKEGKVKIELNKEAVRQKQLMVSSSFTKLVVMI